MSTTKNEYQIKEDYAILIIYSQTYGTKEILINKQDVKKCQKYVWRIMKESKSDKLNVYSSKGGYLIRLIKNKSEVKRLYYKNGNSFDNRRNNIVELMPEKVEIKKGDVFGRLTVLGLDRIEYKKGKYSPFYQKFFKCKCSCGTIVSVGKGQLLYGHTKSCGCLQKDKIIESGHKNKTHGLAETRLYTTWGGMKARCNDKNDKDYGGRGITVCEEWQKFEPFYEWAMNNGYQDNLTIDRIDVNGNYEPSNCRWATKKEQGRNTRVNRYLTYKGETKTMAEWCEMYNIKQNVVSTRIKLGWDLDKVFNEPIDLSKSYHTSRIKNKNKKKEQSEQLKFDVTGES